MYRVSVAYGLGGRCGCHGRWLMGLGFRDEYITANSNRQRNDSDPNPHALWCGWLFLRVLEHTLPLSLPRQSLQDVLVPGHRLALGGVLQVKVAVMPESVPRRGARAA